MNWRALFSHERVSAKARACRNLQRAMQAARRSVSEQCPLFPTTSWRSPDRLRRHAAGDARAHDAERISQLGNTKASAPARCAARVPSQQAEEFASGKRRRSSASCGPCPMMTFEPGRSSEGGFQVLLDTTVHAQEIGRGRPRSTARSGLNTSCRIRVHACEFLKPLGELRHQRGGGPW